jgi:RNA polymerase sigma factor (sigma-70 family)
MYGPVVHHLVRLLSPVISDADTDDAVQDVFVKLVNVLRSGAYDSAKGKFRTYLSTLVRRLLVDRYREAVTRRRDRQVELDAAEQIGIDDDPGAWMDAKWRIACRMAAERRVMEESALAEQSREVWRLLSVEGLSVKDAARRLGIPSNTVSKTKRRIETRIAAVLALYE